MNGKTKKITTAAVISALYVIITYVFAFISSGVIQIRISEMLCVLPCFTPSAIPGVTIGCLISNILIGGEPLDIIFGTLATLIGCIGAYLLRKNKWVAPVPEILANTLIIPWILKLVYKCEDSIPFCMMTVGAGEIISAGILGIVLYSILEKRSFSSNPKSTKNK